MKRLLRWFDGWVSTFARSEPGQRLDRLDPEQQQRAMRSFPPRQ
ncbi:MAG: hypothetical protein AAF467_25155 [Actinomycetota bacterium]